MLVNAPAGGQDRQFAFEAVKPTRQPQTPRLGRLSSFCQSLLLATILMNEFRQAASEFRHYSRTAHIINPRTWNLLVFSPLRSNIGEHA